MWPKNWQQLQQAAIAALRDGTELPELEPDESGDVTIRYGSAGLCVRVNRDTPQIGIFSRVLLDVEATPAPLDYNPCFECKLCVAACPVGALKPDGYFDFVFSISALEHVPDDNQDYLRDIWDDIDRILKPGGYSLHCLLVRRMNRAGRWGRINNVFEFFQYNLCFFYFIFF